MVEFRREAKKEEEEEEKRKELKDINLELLIAIFRIKLE